MKKSRGKPLKDINPKNIILLSFITLIPFLIVSFTPGKVYATSSLDSRSIQLGDIKNNSEILYDYIGDFIESNLFDTLKKIPYITVSENERKILATTLGISEKDIASRLPPKITRKREVNTEPPIYIYGEYSFDKEEDSIFLKLEAKNFVTGIHKNLLEESIPVDKLFSTPGTYIGKAVKNLLRYKIFTINISVFPEEAEIYIDRNFAGKGSIKNYFILPGYHTVSIKSSGYEEYSELVNVLKDNSELNFTLATRTIEKPLIVKTEPVGTNVYANGTLAGKAPVNVNLPENKKGVLVLKTPDYRIKLIPVDKNLSGKKEISALMIEQQHIEELINKVENHKKKAKFYSYIGFGFLGASILLGTQKTILEQKADIYRNQGNESYKKAERYSSIFRYLTWGSSSATLVIFGKSFSEILKYFKGYKELTF